MSVVISMPVGPTTTHETGDQTRFDRHRSDIAWAPGLIRLDVITNQEFLPAALGRYEAVSLCQP
jgi:hypothetical protein